MNKIKATKAEMRKNYRILSVPYCDMQYLLNYKCPVAYSCGQDGWACDYYDIDGVIISTGYNPIKSKNVNYEYKTLLKYERKAQEAKSSEDVNALLKKFIAEITAEAVAA